MVIREVSEMIINHLNFLNYFMKLLEIYHLLLLKDTQIKFVELLFILPEDMLVVVRSTKLGDYGILKLNLNYFYKKAIPNKFML